MAVSKDDTQVSVKYNKPEGRLAEFTHNNTQTHPRPPPPDHSHSHARTEYALLSSSVDWLLTFVLIKKLSTLHSLSKKWKMLR